MFVRLTRPTRRKAGWFAALLYLFCVLAPGAALALGDAASCLAIEIQTTAAMHERASPAAAPSHHHHEVQGNAAPATHDHSQHQHGGKTSPGPCCAMLCLSGIAADPPALTTPSQPISIRVSENFQRLRGEAPPLLYRPPIA
ncbi:MAG: hypothetical protein ABI561_01290 [Bradyrhizobium sp.]